MNRKFLVIVAVLLALSLAATGCGGGQKPAAPAQPGTQPAAPAQPAGEQVDTRPLVVASKTEAISLDPHFDDYPYSSIPQWAAYEALTRHVVKDDGSVGLGPLLAKSWEATDGAKVWTFKLNANVKFQDGTPFDAEAVKFNFERLAAMKKPPSGRVPPIDKIEVLDPLTVKFTLKNPFAAFAEQLSKGPLMVSPTAVKKNEKDGDRGHAWLDDNSAGTGPYKLEKWVRGQTVSLNKNPDYWQGWSGKHVEKILVRIVKEPAVQKSLLETGDADIADGISTDFVDALKQAPGVKLLEGPSVQVLHIMMRPIGPLKDKRVRQALSYVFDYDGFVQAVFKGHAVKAGVLPASSWAHDPSLPFYKTDQNKAKQLMAQAGFPNGGFTLRLQSISPFGFYQLREAQILAENAKQLGIEIKIEDKADAPSFMAAINKEGEGPELFLWGHSTSANDPEDNFRRNYDSRYVPPGGNNRMFYRNPKMDELLDKAVSSTDQNVRRQHYVEAQKILLEDAVGIFTAQPNAILGLRESVKGLKFDPFMFNNAPYYYDLYLTKK